MNDRSDSRSCQACKHSTSGSMSLPDGRLTILQEVLQGSMGHAASQILSHGHKCNAHHRGTLMTCLLVRITKPSELADDGFTTVPAQGMHCSQPHPLKLCTLHATLSSRTTAAVSFPVTGLNMALL